MADPIGNPPPPNTSFEFLTQGDQAPPYQPALMVLSTPQKSDRDTVPNQLSIAPCQSPLTEVVRFTLGLPSDLPEEPGMPLTKTDMTPVGFTEMDLVTSLLREVEDMGKFGLSFNFDRPVELPPVALTEAFRAVHKFSFKQQQFPPTNSSCPLIFSIWILIAEALMTNTPRQSRSTITYQCALPGPEGTKTILSLPETFRAWGAGELGAFSYVAVHSYKDGGLNLKWSLFSQPNPSSTLDSKEELEFFENFLSPYWDGFNVVFPDASSIPFMNAVRGLRHAVLQSPNALWAVQPSPPEPTQLTALSTQLNTLLRFLSLYRTLFSKEFPESFLTLLREDEHLAVADQKFHTIFENLISTCTFLAGEKTPLNFQQAYANLLAAYITYSSKNPVHFTILSHLIQQINQTHPNLMSPDDRAPWIALKNMQGFGLAADNALQMTTQLCWSSFIPYLPKPLIVRTLENILYLLKALSSPSFQKQTTISKDYYNKIPPRLEEPSLERLREYYSFMLRNREEEAIFHTHLCDVVDQSLKEINRDAFPQNKLAELFAKLMMFIWDKNPTIEYFSLDMPLFFNGDMSEMTIQNFFCHENDYEFLCFLAHFSHWNELERRACRILLRQVLHLVGPKIAEVQNILMDHDVSRRSSALKELLASVAQSPPPVPQPPKKSAKKAHKPKREARAASFAFEKPVYATGKSEPVDFMDIALPESLVTLHRDEENPWTVVGKLEIPAVQPTIDSQAAILVASAKDPAAKNFSLWITWLSQMQRAGLPRTLDAACMSSKFVHGALEALLLHIVTSQLQEPPPVTHSLILLAQIILRSRNGTAAVKGSIGSIWPVLSIFNQANVIINYPYSCQLTHPDSRRFYVHLMSLQESRKNYTTHDALIASGRSAIDHLCQALINPADVQPLAIPPICFESFAQDPSSQFDPCPEDAVNPTESAAADVAPIPSHMVIRTPEDARQSLDLIQNWIRLLRAEDICPSDDRERCLSMRNAAFNNMDHLIARIVHQINQADDSVRGWQTLATVECSRQIAKEALIAVLVHHHATDSEGLVAQRVRNTNSLSTLHALIKAHTPIRLPPPPPLLSSYHLPINYPYALENHHPRSPKVQTNVMEVIHRDGVLAGVPKEEKNAKKLAKEELRQAQLPLYEKVYEALSYVLTILYHFNPKN